MPSRRAPHRRTRAPGRAMRRMRRRRDPIQSIQISTDLMGSPDSTRRRMRLREAGSHQESKEAAEGRPRFGVANYEFFIKDV